VIARDYSNFNRRGPSWIGSESEISSLFIITGDTLSAVKTISVLYKDLLISKWMLERAQYDFFLQHLNESLNSIFSHARSTEPIQSYQRDFTLLKQMNKT
jgi:hypothetical protein